MVIDCEKERKKMKKKLIEMDEIGSKEKRIEIEKEKLIEKEILPLSVEQNYEDSSTLLLPLTFPHLPMEPPFHHIPHFSFRFTKVDGDGTVPVVSAANDCLGCVARFEIKNVEHMEMLWNKRVLNIIANILGVKIHFQDLFRLIN
jgi:hypothetical protein